MNLSGLNIADKVDIVIHYKNGMIGSECVYATDAYYHYIKATHLKNVDHVEIYKHVKVRFSNEQKTS